MKSVSNSWSPVFVVALGLLLPTAASAEQHLQELFLSPLAYTQEKDELQVAVGSPLGRDQERVLALEYGLTDRLQVEAEWTSGSEAGSQPVALAVKYRPAHARLRGVALGLELESADDTRAIAPYAVVARQFGGAQWLAHAAPSFDREGLNEWRAGGAGVVALGRSYVTAELVWKNERGADSTVIFAPGLAVAVGNSIEAAVGARLAANGERAVLAGIRWNRSFGRAE